MIGGLGDELLLVVGFGLGDVLLLAVGFGVGDVLLLVVGFGVGAVLLPPVGLGLGDEVLLLGLGVGEELLLDVGVALGDELLLLLPVGVGVALTDELWLLDDVALAEEELLVDDPLGLACCVLGGLSAESSRTAAFGRLEHAPLTIGVPLVTSLASWAGPPAIVAAKTSGLATSSTNPASALAATGLTSRALGVLTATTSLS